MICLRNTLRANRVFLFVMYVFCETGMAFWRGLNLFEDTCGLC